MLPATPAARFAAIIDLLCRAVAARGAGGRLAAPLIVLVWSRLRRIGGRVMALAARLAAGPLPAGPLPTVRAPRRAPRPARPPPPVPPQRLPRGHAWLLRLVPEAAGGASQLQHLLADAEMAALLAAAPQMGRLLRPLCRMLGVRLPAVPVPPPPPCPAGPAAPPRATGRSAPPAAAPPPRRTTPAAVVVRARPARGPPVAAVSPRRPGVRPNCS